MTERPKKLTPIATLVVWGARRLTLGEKVVWYHDWALDQGGADGCYASHAAIAARLGDSLTPATVSKIRQRLKRLALHDPLPRRDARNLGWVATLPAPFHPHTYREVPGLAVALDEYLVRLAAWQEEGRDGPDTLDPAVQTPRTPRSTPPAAALGGRGESLLSVSSREARLPSAVSEKRVSASARRLRREPDDIERAMDPQELQAFEAMLARMAPDKAARLRRVAGL